MSIDPELVAKAVEIFRNKKFSRSDDIKGGVYLLEGYRRFENMEADELEAYVRAALAQVATTNAPHRHETSGPKGAGGKPRTLPDFRSPFVFVVLPDEVAAADVDVPVDIPIRDGYCATIDYRLQAETPILIGAEAERNGPDKGVVLPIRGADGNYVIPGATVRGLVRAAVEIVAHGKLGSANLHHRFGIRDFEHPYYEQVAKVGLVKAGWLSGEIDASGNPVAMRITPCDLAHVLIDDMASGVEFKGKVSARVNWIRNSLNQKYTALGMVTRVSGQRTEFNFTRTFGYSPPVEDNGRQVRKPAKGGAAGVPVVSGKLPGSGGNKKFEYAFFDRHGAEQVPIRPGLIDDFVRLNSKPSKNRPAPDGSWKELKPTFDGGARIPVFYVGDLVAQGHDFFFGLTRMLKLPHERSVGEVLGQQPNHVAAAQWRETIDGRQEIVRYHADFVESLFGFVVEPKDFLDLPGSASPRGVARKGRVAFSFAELAGGPASAQLSDPVTVVQSAPRASYSPFYLKPRVPGQKGAEADYSALKPPRLAGRKRYLPRDPQPDFNGRLRAIAAMGERQVVAIRASSGGRAPSADVQSRLRFLLTRNGDTPLVFEGKIRLHNVTAAELGAVLFALTHGGDPSRPYRHMVGRAKPFGAGQMRLRSLDLAVESNSNTPVVAPELDEVLNETTDTGFCSSHSTASMKPFLAAFAAHMRRQPGLQAFPNVASILEFLGASDPTAGAADHEKFDYMALEEFNPVRKATKPLKDLRAGPPARGSVSDGRLLPAPRVAKPVFWT